MPRTTTKSLKKCKHKFIVDYSGRTVRCLICDKSWYDPLYDLVRDKDGILTRYYNGSGDTQSKPCNGSRLP